MRSNVCLGIGISCLLCTLLAWADGSKKIDPRDGTSTRLSRENTDEALLRKRLWWDYMDLIADYNELLNQMQTESLTSSTDKGAHALDEVQKFFLDYSVKEQLSHPPLPMKSLLTIQNRIEQSKDNLQTAKEEWLRHNQLSADKAAGDLKLACTQRVLDSKPISGQDETFYEKLIHQCAVHARNTLHGVAVTYQGTEVVHKDEPKPIRIASFNAPTSTQAPSPMPRTEHRSQNAVHSTRAPTPSPTPAPVPTPKPIKSLSDDDQAALALMPPLGDAPLVQPPTQAALFKQAAAIVKNYDPDHPKIDPGLGEFNLAAEARANERSNPFFADVRYSVALHHWKQSIEAYKKQDEASGETDALKRLQNILAASHQEYWKPYTKKDAQLTDVLLNEGGNCDLQSGFIPALAAALNVKLPPNKRLLLQVFTGHVQPVIYDSSDNSVLDLAHNKVATGTPVPLYDPTILVNGWLHKEKLNLARPQSDFIAVNANIAPDPRLLAKNTRGGAEDNTTTDTIHDLPDPGVRWLDGNDKIPDHATMDKPDILHPEKTDYNDHSENQASDNQGSLPSFGAAPLPGGPRPQTIFDSKKKMTLAGVQYEVDIRVKDYPQPEDVLLEMDEGIRTFTVIFSKKEDAEYADKLTNEVDLLAFIVARKFETDIIFNTARRKISEINQMIADDASRMKGPLHGLHISDIADSVQSLDIFERGFLFPAFYNTPTFRSAVLNKAFPHLSEATQAAKDFEKRITKEHWAALKKYLSDPDSDGIEQSLRHISNYLDLESAATVDMYAEERLLREAIYSWMLDPEHVAWTKQDLKHRKPQKTQPPTPMSSPTPKPQPTDNPALPDRPSRYGAHVPPLPEELKQENSPASQKIQKQEEASWVPKRPLLVRDPVKIERALRILTRGGNQNLSPSQQEAVQKLWTQDFTRAYIKSLQTIIDAKGSARSWNEIWDTMVTFTRAFPEKARCQVYGAEYGESNDELFGCVPTELARMQMLILQKTLGTIWIGSPLPMRIGGRIYPIKAEDLIKLIDAQINHKALPDWFVKAKTEADALPENPDYPH